MQITCNWVAGLVCFQLVVFVIVDHERPSYRICSIETTRCTRAEHVCAVQHCFFAVQVNLAPAIAPMAIAPVCKWYSQLLGNNGSTK